MNEINHLIISSSIDYSPDLICSELERRGCHYLRINRDFFYQYRIVYDLEKRTIHLYVDNKEYWIKDTSLISVYFRAPVFNRYSKNLSLEEQLRRSQWSSFIRNLIVFDKAKWINHPVATYRAENKVYQLMQAEKLGLSIPHTYVGNNFPDSIEDDKKYIVKALDTPIFYDEGQEMFTYSTEIYGRELKAASLRDAPIIIQDFLSPKTDLRVTFIGNKIFPVSIQYDGKGIDGDWRRKNKDGLSYIPTSIPKDIEDKLFCLMGELGLIFGGIDLAYCNGRYYFIEVNPTGEWGWLVRAAGFEINKAIVDELERT